MTIKKLAGLAVAMLLAACGAGDGGSTGQGTQAHAKAAIRQQKSQAADYQTLVQQLYVAYFGRPADPGGLANFSAALQAAGAPTDIQGLMTAYGSNAAVKQLVDSFGTSAESSKLYGSGSTSDFVKAIFQNVLGRAPQAAGLSYWSNAIDSGSLTRGDAALAIMDGALTNTTDQGKLDAQLIQNRLTVAAQFTDELQVQGISSSYAGATAASSARTMLSAVGSSTDLVAYQSSVSSTVTGIAAASGKTVLEPLAGTINITGTVDGLTQLSSFNSPAAVARAPNGDLYVADRNNHTIRKISNGLVSTIAGSAGVSGYADGVGSAARFYWPSGIALDSAGNIYVADQRNDAIRKVTPSGVVTTIAGAPGQNNSIIWPISLTLDGQGNVYVVSNCAVFKISPAGIVSTLAGSSGQCTEADGVGATARFNSPTGIASDGSAYLYVADSAAYTIRKVSMDGTVTTFAGTSGVSSSVDASGTNAKFTGPHGICSDASGNLFVTDLTWTNPNFDPPSSSIRKIAPNGDVTTYPTAISFDAGVGIAADSGGNIYFTEQIDNSEVVGGTVDVMSPAGVMTVVAGQPWILNSVDGQGSAASFTLFMRMTQDNNGNLIVIDENKLRKVSPAGVVTTLFTASDFVGGGAIAFDNSGNAYVTDDFSPKIWKIAADGTVSIFAGSNGEGYQDGTGTQASFLRLHDIVFDGHGAFYVADYQSVRKVTTEGVVTTLATWSGDTSLWPIFKGIATDLFGNVFVSDSSRQAIYKITPSGQLSLLAGTPTTVAAGELLTLGGSADGTESQASFYKPSNMVTDSAGNLYVSDSGNSTIRKITPQGSVTTIAGVADLAGFVPGALPGGLQDPHSLVLQGRTLYIADWSGVAAIYNLP